MICDKLAINTTADNVIKLLKKSNIKVDKVSTMVRDDGSDGFIAIYHIGRCKLYFKRYGMPLCYRLYKKESDE